MAGLNRGGDGLVDEVEEGFAEGGLLGLGEELGGGSLGEDLAVADDAEAVAEVFGLVHHVGGEEDALAGAFEFEDGVFDVLGGDGVEAGGGFVEDDYGGVVDDGAGEGDALFHSGGEAVVGAVGVVGDGEEFECGLDSVFEFGGWEAVEGGEEAEGFAWCEALVEPGGGGEEAEVAADVFGVCADVEAGDFCGSGGGGEDGGEAAEGGGFARSVGAEEAVDLAGECGECGVGDGADEVSVGVFVVLGEVEDFDCAGGVHRWGTVTPPCRWGNTGEGRAGTDFR